MFSEEPNSFFEDEDEEFDTVWRDLTLTIAGLLLIVIILILPFINPPSKKASEDITIIENVIVQISWPNEKDVDVDLWCQAPGDTPVGYSNQGALVFNLMRDDLGTLYQDPLDINFEECRGRGIVPGEYAVNIHLFSVYGMSSKLPVPVSIVVSIKPSSRQPMAPLLTAKVSLNYVGEEITVFRFRLEQNGELVPGSAHNLFKPLRAAGAR